MPIKIDRTENICAKTRTKIKTKAKTNTILLKYGSENQKQSACTGISIIKDSKFNPMHVMALKVLDKANILIANHPKLGKIVLALGERILKNADCLK